MTDYQTPDRMRLKEQAIPIPELKGKSVLDVGCDHGHFCWLASEAGASCVVGIDRNRKVNGNFMDIVKRNEAVAKLNGHANCHFTRLDLGKQWHRIYNDAFAHADPMREIYEPFDVVFCFSMYHHVYENCGDHQSIWFWLWLHTREVLLWENPVDTTDPVVKLNVTKPYFRCAIDEAARYYFDVEVIGAGHVATREVWRCRPKHPSRLVMSWRGMIEKGHGGASKAFRYAEDRRIREIKDLLDVTVIPGSVNIWLREPFRWNSKYLRAEILDVVDRKEGLTAPWEKRWARLYPVNVQGVDGFAFRFEGERYASEFIEIISDKELPNDPGVTVNVVA